MEGFQRGLRKDPKQTILIEALTRRYINTFIRSKLAEDEIFTEACFSD
jgi:hypothetical protein